MIRRPPRSTQGVSSAASDVYKRQMLTTLRMVKVFRGCRLFQNDTFQKNALQIKKTPYKCTEDDIIKFLDPYTPMANSMKWILRAPQQKKGVVLRMQSSEDVEKVIAEKNKKELYGRKLEIRKYSDSKYEDFKQKDTFDSPQATPQTTPKKEEQQSSLR
eukprot:TRINITY_DN12573_c0_g1_i4.p2 TRINITY_DN12573_c0_g1~~TRINITY_DN12573_c0_g1_i4.p2  ORF type:complete len:159 (+),score=36.94 TRINITY_DN12573_c0_g1_i4:84-560(+)